MIGSFEEGKGGFRPQTIMEWTDPLSDIPPGWAICDGNNGTPDLTGKMLAGPTSPTDSAGVAGGQEVLTLSESQLPPHSHSFSTNRTGSHDHTIDTQWMLDWNSDSGNDATEYTGSLQSIGYNGNHSHTISTGTTGSDSAVNNLPVYVNVIYIMKL